ncbi:4680_t:CDS:2, partial [Funneliformis geosporum]
MTKLKALPHQIGSHITLPVKARILREHSTNINEADENEKNWWLNKGSLGSLDVDEESKRCNVSLQNELRRLRPGGFLTIVTIIELPTGEHEATGFEFSHLFMNVFNNATPQDSCLKFCRVATPQQNPNATTFDAIEEIEFGFVHANGRESYFCTGPHKKGLQSI